MTDFVKPYRARVGGSIPLCKMAKAVEGAKENDQFKKGRWTEKEHTIFVEGLQKYGKDWKHIAKMLKTRTSIQIRTHAQKYFLKYPEDERRYSQMKIKPKRNNNNNNNSAAPTSPKRAWTSQNNGWPSKSNNNPQAQAQARVQVQVQAPLPNQSQPTSTSTSKGQGLGLGLGHSHMPRHKKTQRLKKTQSSPSVLTSEPATEFMHDENESESETANETAAIPLQFLPHTSTIPEDFPLDRFPDNTDGATSWGVQRGRSASALVQSGRLDQVYGIGLQNGGAARVHGFNNLQDEDRNGHMDMNHVTEPMDRMADSSSSSHGLPAHVLEDFNGFPLDEHTDYLLL